MVDFHGHVVMVTGAAGSLGQAVVRAYASAGATLVMLDRVTGRLRKIYPDLAENSKHILLDSVDVSDPSSVNEAVKRTMDSSHRIDVLANTVGGYRARHPVHQTPIETWDFMMALNARTAFILSKTIIPYMLEQGKGSIVHVAARAALSGAQNGAAYSTAKSAIIRMVESMAAEYRHMGISINCVLPGTIDTPSNRESMPQADFDRWVPPQAIADVILFLTSDAARAVNGAAVPVYGRS